VDRRWHLDAELRTIHTGFLPDSLDGTALAAITNDSARRLDKDIELFSAKDDDPICPSHAGSDTCGQDWARRLAFGGKHKEQMRFARCKISSREGCFQNDLKRRDFTRRIEHDQWACKEGDNFR